MLKFNNKFKNKLDLNLDGIIVRFNEFKKYLATEIAEMKEKLKDVPGTNYNLGLYHLKKGNIRDAIMRFKFVLKLNNNNAFAHYYLAQALFLLNKNAEANEHIKQALALKSNWPEALYAYNKINDNDNEINNIPDQVTEDFAELSTYLNEKTLQYKNDFISSTIIRNINDKNPSLKILDFGCNKAGYLISLAKKQFVHSIDAICFSTEICENLLKSRIGSQNLFNSLETITPNRYIKNPTSKMYDLIIADHSACHFRNILEILTPLANNLNKNGIIALLLFINPDDDGTIFDGYNNIFLYTLQNVESGLESLGFTKLEVTRYYDKDSKPDDKKESDSSKEDAPSEYMLLYQKKS